MAQDSGSNLAGSLIVAAIVVGLSIVTGSFMLKTAQEESSQRLAAVLGEMQALTAKLAAAPAAGRAAAPTRAGRPDPEKVYQVAIGDAPVKGPNTAKIKIVEWSDFQ